jgi:hypothetical protein
MHPLLHLSLNDLRNILREQILVVLFLVLPLICLLVASLVVPLLTQRYPDLVPYLPVILMMLTMQIAAGVGFVTSSMFLDEKDQQLLPVLRTLPLSISFFLGYRLLFSFLYTFSFAWLMGSVTGLVSFSLGESLLYALLFAFPAPVIMLVMASLAGNKVEGLAIFKGINFLHLLPLAAFFMPGSNRHVFGILPMHWSFQFIHSMALDAPVWGYLAAGLSLHVLLLLGLLWWFQRRVMRG